MKQEIEIEFKNIVTKEDFLKLLSHFSVKESDFKKQKNYYFDTENFQIKASGSALRIREKQNKYTLTLKQPHKVGLLETHQELTYEEANRSFNGEALPKGAIATQLYTSFQIDLSKCKYLGSLITNRAEISYHGGTLVFDHSIYLGVEDFEIEYEVTDEEIGKEIFSELFINLQIPIKKTENKIKRFFLRKAECK
ncbi:CYTH domain-containing protein [Anaerobacillus alkalilacustris]|uniref:CYTH domain-containing protein n=1 Tax=Anaerobacillus alkalilacustris TaxID=393763 RepID=A0A1S2LDW4_9BACI|nr:CYTH domain-containing protein [Anaerobacillus alkalilacustris]OIJ10430.1 CYTH domain-containing protein [Anaerobacillus alkalilacustris]